MRIMLNLLRLSVDHMDRRSGKLPKFFLLLKRTGLINPPELLSQRYSLLRTDNLSLAV